MAELIYSSGVATLVYPRCVRHVRVPDEMIARYERLLREDVGIGVDYAETIGGTSSVVSAVSRELSNLFGVGESQIGATIHNLVEHRLGDTDDLSQKFLLSLSETAEELRTHLVNSYSKSPLSVRRARAAEIFSDMSMLEIELMGWQGLVHSNSSELIEFRDNAIEGTLEALYKYADRYYLLATCKTGNIVLIPVGESRSCEEAQLWLTGQDVIEGFDLPRFFSRGRS